ncbi:MAG: cation diffusion facilitator family transporter [Oligoflexia bacterium]|nr:cation diffusion facilitator family transporter [Oligoflexia bacterium]
MNEANNSEANNSEANKNEVHEKCLQCRKQAGTVQLVRPFFLIVIGLFFGVMGNSKGLLADGLFSIANMLIALSISLGKKWGKKDEDEAHPYGYGKIEFIIGAFAGGSIILGTLMWVYNFRDSIIFNYALIFPSYLIILVSILSILVNEMALKYLRCMEKQFAHEMTNTGTNAEINFWAIRGESFSAVAVILGVLGTRFGWLHADGIVALLITVAIVVSSAKFFWDSVSGLLDKSIPSEQVAQIIKAIGEIGPDAFELKRTIAYLNGRNIRVNIEIKINEVTATIEHFDQIADAIKKRIFQLNSAITHINVAYSL